MITNSYDNSKPFLKAEDLYNKVEPTEVVTIATFKKKVVDYVISHYGATISHSYKTTNDTQDIYSFNIEGKTYQIYLSPIGACIASTIMNEVSVVTGSHKFIFFGSCGVLDEAKCRGKLIVPTSSYRDEGISYHYLPASDYVEIKNHSKVAEVFNANNIPYVKGKIWTTDAIYMETVNKVNKRKEDGCIAVEMEVSGVEAVARHLNIDNYHFMFSADSLGSEEDWERTDLGGDKELLLQLNAFEAALKLAKTL